MSIEKMLEVCEEDTHRFVSYGAAIRISDWRTCVSDKERIKFIQTAIRKDNNSEIGFAVHLNGGTSLESIVLSYPELFTDEDYVIASSHIGEY